jgi:NADPH:quinone reductase-like Zn-dependent oxidoreductase
MRAAVLLRLNEEVQVIDLPAPELQPGGALVELHAAALNHRDEFIRVGLYPKIQLPCVPGSDGAGVVAAAGEGVDAAWVGKRVVIDPGFLWGSNPRAQSKQFHILGMPTQGTLAEQIVVPGRHLAEVPAHLSFEEAAALPLAGVTAYRALVTRGELRSGEHVLVTGIGGGVAALALMVAKALGAVVSVTSSSERKRAAALDAGAAAALDYNDPDWPKQLAAEVGRPPSLIVDGAGGAGVNRLIECAEPGGRIVSYGATRGLPEALDLHRLFFKQLDLRGTTMGTAEEFRALIALVGREKLRPLIDQTFPLSEADRAFKRIAGAEQLGKIVVACTTA